MRILLPVALLAAGCAADLNPDPALRGIELPALAADPPSALDATPAPAGPDRAAWMTETIRVPLREVAHHPAYGADVLLPADGPRRSGTYPTAASALATPVTPGADLRDMAWEWLAPLRLIGATAHETLARGVMPWDVVRSPRVTSERVGASEAPGATNPAPENAP